MMELTLLTVALLTCLGFAVWVDEKYNHSELPHCQSLSRGC